MDFAFHATGIVAHLWALVGALGVVVQLNSYNVRMLNRKIVLKWNFYAPYVLAIFYWCWLILE